MNLLFFSFYCYKATMQKEPKLKKANKNVPLAN